MAFPVRVPIKCVIVRGPRRPSTLERGRRAPLGLPSCSSDHPTIFFFGPAPITTLYRTENSINSINSINSMNSINSIGAVFNDIGAGFYDIGAVFMISVRFLMISVRFCRYPWFCFDLGAPYFGYRCGFVCSWCDFFDLGAVLLDLGAVFLISVRLSFCPLPLFLLSSLCICVCPCAPMCLKK